MPTINSIKNRVWFHENLKDYNLTHWAKIRPQDVFWTSLSTLKRRPLRNESFYDIKQIENMYNLLTTYLLLLLERESARERVSVFYMLKAQMSKKSQPDVQILSGMSMSKRDCSQTSILNLICTSCRHTDMVLDRPTQYRRDLHVWQTYCVWWEV